MGKKPPSNPVKKLETELRRIKKVSGPSDVVSARLILVLEAFNKYAEQKTDLNIDSVTIASKISIVGDTSSPGNTLIFFKAIKGKLEISQERVYTKAGRNHFSITVVSKR
jgi:hypothetical protein